MHLNVSKVKDRSNFILFPLPNMNTYSSSSVTLSGMLKVIIGVFNILFLFLLN